MPQQLNEILAALTGASATAGTQIGPGLFVLLMAVSLVSSFFISYLYLHFYASRSTGSQVHRAFPLLGISITAIFVCIQFSLPLSLGLLGALSIVRFRTPIKEPEEIGFIMLVIALSIAIATFKLAFAGLIFVIALVALVVQASTRLFRGGAGDGAIVIAVPAGGVPVDPSALTAVLRRRVAKARLESVSQTGAETVMSFSFRGISEGALLALPAEIRGAASDSTFNVFFSRPGAL
jgi:hypothetical protein